MKLKTKFIILIVLLIPLEAIADYYFFGQYSGFGVKDYLIRCSVESFLFIFGFILGGLNEPKKR